MARGVVHFEIPADDEERAGKFYSSAFGWEINPMPQLSYTIVKTTPTDETGMPSVPGSINGGMFRRDAGLTSPVITVDVEDIEEALAKIEELGGAVFIPRQDVGGMGWSAYFRDTEGNVLGLWQNAAPPAGTAETAVTGAAGAGSGTAGNDIGA